MFSVFGGKLKILLKSFTSILYLAIFIALFSSPSMAQQLPQSSMPDTRNPQPNASQLFTNGSNVQPSTPTDILSQSSQDNKIRFPSGSARPLEIDQQSAGIKFWQLAVITVVSVLALIVLVKILAHKKIFAGSNAKTTSYHSTLPTYDVPQKVSSNQQRIKHDQPKLKANISQKKKAARKNKKPKNSKKNIN
jgi:hypothetical protein